MQVRVDSEKAVFVILDGGDIQVDIGAQAYTITNEATEVRI